MVGYIINNYVLEHKLGEGGMGDVYFARHNRIDRVVAIKILHKRLFDNPGIQNRFKNEANALIKLGHPNIVKIYDYVEQEQFACLIMEYIDGYTLDDYLSKITGPLPGAKATGIISGVLDAVQYAHDHHIFHRDIKPGNIMVSRDGTTVRIMDFSIAKFADGTSLKTTHANAQLGTPFYMSPEQVKGLPYTAVSDIYSIGVTLFEMVTGKCPYIKITNLFELQSKIVNEPLPPTGNYIGNVPVRIQDAIQIATNKSPDQRFKSCNEFKNYLLANSAYQPGTQPNESLKEVVKPITQEAAKPAVTAPEGKKKSGKKTGWLLLGLGLLVVVIAVLLWPSKPQPPLFGKEKAEALIKTTKIEKKATIVDSTHQLLSNTLANTDDTAENQRTTILQQYDQFFIKNTSIDSLPDNNLPLPNYADVYRDLNGTVNYNGASLKLPASTPASFDVDTGNNQCNAVFSFKATGTGQICIVNVNYKREGKAYKYLTYTCSCDSKLSPPLPKKAQVMQDLKGVTTCSQYASVADNIQALTFNPKLQTPDICLATITFTTDNPKENCTVIATYTNVGEKFRYKSNTSCNCKPIIDTPDTGKGKGDPPPPSKDQIKKDFLSYLQQRGYEEFGIPEENAKEIITFSVTKEEYSKNKINYTATVDFSVRGGQHKCKALYTWTGNGYKFLTVKP